MPNRFFVTRHRGAITWAVRHGLRAKKVEMNNLDISLVAPGDVVMGTLPVQLVAELNQRGAHYWHLSMNIPDTMRGAELSADQMDEFGARLEEFRVQHLGTRMGVISTPEVWTEQEKWPVLHLCIATGQTLPNLLPLLHRPWEQVAIFTSPGMTGRAEHLRWLASAIAERRGLDIKPHMVKLPADGGYNDIRECVISEVARLRKRFPEHRIELNITGGHKLMTLGFHDALRSQAQIYYCNTEQGRIETIDPPGREDQSLPTDLLDLETYLFGQGLRITRNQSVECPSFAVMKSRISLTALLTLRLHQLDPALRTIAHGQTDHVRYGWLATMLDMAHMASPKKGAFRPLQQSRIVEGTRARPGVTHLINDLIDAGYLKDRSGIRGDEIVLEFSNLEAAKYLSGGYLEEFTLLSAASLGLPPTYFAANVGLDVLQPRDRPKDKQELNELDLAMVWGNRLLVVECKAGRALSHNAQDILNKSSTLRHAVAGLHGSTWVVSSSPVNRADILDRADLTGTTLLAGHEELEELPQRLAQWAGVELPKTFRPWKDLLPALHKPKSNSVASKKTASRGMATAKTNR